MKQNAPQARIVKQNAPQARFCCSMDPDGLSVLLM